MKKQQPVDSTWYRLDNSAKIYPAIMSDRQTTLFRIAVNLTINLLNKEKRYTLAGDDMESITNKVSMEHFKLEESDDTEEMRHMILELVERLPVKQQVVFNLKYIEGFKENEIAEIADIPVGTVKSRLNIARNRVKQWLKESPE